MSTQLAPGAVIAGRYRLERLLGRGGMGVVWSASHSVTRKRVALKFLKGPIHLRPELRVRFLREARAASAVNHPNVVAVHDVFELDEDTLVMVMDLLEGETLRARIARENALSLRATADILIQVVSAVGAAHAAGVVHRDLKPDNVFLVSTAEDWPHVYVLDFGIAKLVFADAEAADSSAITGTGAILGTACYMSPEQSCGEKDLDHRTDIWSLGAILYECVSGARPVEGENIGQVVKRLINDAIAPLSVMVPGIAEDIDQLVHRMLARQRERRPSDLGEVFAVLARYAAATPPGVGSVTRYPSVPAKSEREIVSETPRGDAEPLENVHTVALLADREPSTSPSVSEERRSVSTRLRWAFVGIIVLGAPMAAITLRGVDPEAQKAPVTTPAPSSLASSSSLSAATGGSTTSAQVQARLENTASPAAAPVASRENLDHARRLIVSKVQLPPRPTGQSRSRGQSTRAEVPSPSSGQAAPLESAKPAKPRPGLAQQPPF